MSVSTRNVYACFGTQLQIGAERESFGRCFRTRGLRKDSGRLDNWKKASVLIGQRPNVCSSPSAPERQIDPRSGRLHRLKPGRSKIPTAYSSTKSRLSLLGNHGVTGSAPSMKRLSLRLPFEVGDVQVRHPLVSLGEACTKVEELGLQLRTIGRRHPT